MEKYTKRLKEWSQIWVHSLDNRPTWNFIAFCTCSVSLILFSMLSMYHDLSVVCWMEKHFTFTSEINILNNWMKKIFVWKKTSSNVKIMMLKIKTIFRFSGKNHGSSNFVFQSPGKNFSFSKKKLKKSFLVFHRTNKSGGRKKLDKR